MASSSKKTAGLSDIVTDWGGFERLVAQLHETGNVVVEHNQVLIGKSGAPRQIDVLVRHQVGLHEHLVIVECKYRNQPVERLYVDALAATIKDVNASKGVIFSTQGFQSGAITAAKYEGIDLYRIREPTDDEWGRPGRVLEFNMQVYSLSIDKLDMPGAMSFLGMQPKTNKIDLRFDYVNNDVSRTPVLNKVQFQTLEEYIIDGAARAAQQALPPGMFVKDGEVDLEVMFKIATAIDFKTPIMIEMNGGTVIASKLTFDLGVDLLQSRLIIDRAEKMTFVLAVEDCVRDVLKSATRAKDETVTTIAPWEVDPNPSDEPVYQNESLAKIRTKGLVPFDKFQEIPYNEYIVSFRQGGIRAGPSF